MLYYVPLEHIDQRYTVHMDRDIEMFLQRNKVEYTKIMPDIGASKPLKEGLFLDSAYTCKFKSAQLQMIAQLYEDGKVTDDDSFFFSDLWFPGIEQLAYMNYFNNVNARIKGVIHAGSFTDTDFVRDMERWALKLEEIIFDIADTIFVASDFIKADIVKKRVVNPWKIIVTGLPLDYTNLDKHINLGHPKENTVVFNGRLCDEKQPHLFDELAKQVQERVDFPVKFVKTQEQDLCKDAYYELLATSKVVVSYALQENFGFGIAEASELGCYPVLPNRLVYPELYSDCHLYDTFEQSVDMTVKALTKDWLNGALYRSSIGNPEDIFCTWFDTDVLDSDDEYDEPWDQR